MFRLPWSTEAPGDKIMEKATLHKSKPLPTYEMPNLMSKIKRKRTDSPEPTFVHHAQVVKKWKSAQGEAKSAMFASSGTQDTRPYSATPPDAPASASAEILRSRPMAHIARREESSASESSRIQPPDARLDCIGASRPAVDSGLSPVQQAIEAQINYEILLKHNELRLIEQELAKCQVSLEQLRRCSLIPFPGTEGLSEHLSLGTGAALQTPAGYTEPLYAAPWGVTDGPYTRHYAKWLVSDVKFDSVSERALVQQAQGYFGMGEGRATRGSFADYGSASRGRTSRTSTGMLKLTPLGETPAPTPKVDPLLHKRSTDGQWVRLYCAQCGHSNFSNTQGFLNHCRIKHSQVFKSHDQAAIACGVPVEVNEVGNPVTATEPVSTSAATPVVNFPAPAAPGIVHPLATQASPLPQAKGIHRDPSATFRHELVLPASSNLVKSSSTPYLLARLQNQGFEGDLKELVDTATSKIDLDAIEHSDDDSTDTSVVPTPILTKPPTLARLPPNTSLASKTASMRSSSKKGSTTSHARLPMSFPSTFRSESGHDMLSSPVELSPHAVDSNPGLVSDHDDDDDEDADDAHSQPDLLMHDDDVVVEDASDVEGVQERTCSRQGLNSCFEKGEASRVANDGH